MGHPVRNVLKLKLNGTDTDTDTDAPIVYSTSLTDILARKSARVGQVGGQVGEDRRACPARGSWQAERGSRRTRRLLREDPRAEVGEDVRVGVCVGVGVGPMEFKLTKSSKTSKT